MRRKICVGVFVCTQSAGGAARDPASMLAGVALRKALSTFAGLALLTGGATTATTRIAFGSCNFADAPQPFWPILASRKPDLFIWGGDNVYADQKTIVDRRSAASLAPGERTRFSARNKSEHEAMYERQKQVPSYAAFAKAVPIVGTWDDHDCGINDADRHFAHKHERQALHLDFLGVPREHPRRARLGVYNAHVVDHGPGRRVKVILLDTRFHRDAWPWHPGGSTPEASDVLGEEQWSWLERELSAPTTPTDTSDASVATDSDLAVDLHLVVSGIQVLPLVAAAHEHHESWVHFPTSRRRLFSLLARAAAPALLLSGDVHFAELSEAACFGGAGAHSTDATASPTEERTHVERTHVERYARVGRLLEFTSSGLTHAWSEGWSWPRPWPLPLLFRLGWWLWSLVGVHPWRLAAYPGLNVGEVLVHHEAKEVELIALGTDGAPKLSMRVGLKDLIGGGQQGEGGEAMGPAQIECVPIHGVPPDARVKLSRYVFVGSLFGIVCGAIGGIIGTGYCVLRLVLRRPRAWPTPGGGPRRAKGE